MYWPYIFYILFEFNTVCQGLQPNVWQVDFGHQEWPCITGDDLVASWSGNHCKLAGFQLGCHSVGWYDFGFALAVGCMGGSGGARDGLQLLADSSGIGGGGDTCGVRHGAGKSLRRICTKHHQVWWAANAPRVGSVDGELKLWDERLLVLQWQRHQAAPQQVLHSPVETLHSPIAVGCVRGSTMLHEPVGV